jgi:hypothetical protein
MVYGGTELLALGKETDHERMRDGFVHSVEHQGKIIACGGLIPVWPDCTVRAAAWGLLSKDIASLFPFIHKNVLRVMDESPFNRIEAHTNPNFPPAERWIRMLGFEIETAWKPFFFPDGSGAQEWRRIR